MYFAILGRHPKLSLAEFALVQTTILRRQAQIVFFETELDESFLLALLAKLGGIVKRGKVVEEKSREVRKGEEIEGNEGSEEVKQFLTGVTLVGVNDQKLGMELKKFYGIKRFKIVEQISTDLEVKQEGKELIDFGSGKIGLVLGWQDIAHFELIDFGKPASGMEVGMMPSKLAQILVNIAIMKNGLLRSARNEGNNSSYGGDKLTIYDPFCGFGTTGFVANRVGHHFVGSDLVITGAKENAKRWKDIALEMTEELHFTVFKHDVTEPFDHPLVKKIDVIVSEGWLGPVISRKTRESELLVHAEKIKVLYFTFLNNISAVIPQVPMVLTIPHYSRLPDAILPEIVTHAVTLGYHIEDLGVYSRKGQEVCRQVVVLSRNC